MKLIKYLEFWSAGIVSAFLVLMTLTLLPVMLITQDTSLIENVLNVVGNGFIDKK
ncbi:MAG: hypothetical protein H0Z33_10275 [Bacillaceae bacterium]|nr:hypothetical protein [Bacillaceae bacterium]